MTKLNHLDNSGNAIMIDVRNKKTSHRVAIATGKILMKPETCRLIKDSMIKKGIEFRRGNAGGGNQLRQPYLKPYIKDMKYVLEPSCGSCESTCLTKCCRL